jgi:hypothetical protein
MIELIREKFPIFLIVIGCSLFLFVGKSFYDDQLAITKYKGVVVNKGYYNQSNDCNKLMMLFVHQHVTLLHKREIHIFLFHLKVCGFFIINQDIQNQLFINQKLQSSIKYPSIKYPSIKYPSM